MTNQLSHKSINRILIGFGIAFGLCVLGGFLFCYRYLYKSFGYTIIDINGNQISDHCFDNPFSFGGADLAVVEIYTPMGKRFGYINKEGDYEIFPLYEEASDFCESGIAIVDGTTYIDKNGTVIITSPYKELNGYKIKNYTENGLAWIPAKDKKWYLYNTKGEQISKKGYDIAFVYSRWGCDRFDVWNDVSEEGRRRWVAGYVDQYGTQVIPFAYVGVGPFADNGLAVAVVEDDDLTQTYGYIDEQGAFVIEPQYTWAYTFSEGLAYVCGEDDTKNLVTFINSKGEVCIQLDGYSSYYEFKNGYCVVIKETSDQNKTKLYGAMNKDGTITIPAIYDHLTDFDENGISIVEKITESTNVSERNIVYGYLRSDNTYLVEPQFSYAGKFHDGYACVQDAETGLYGYIDINGEWFLEPQFKDALDFSDGYACVYLDKNQKIEKTNSE